MSIYTEVNLTHGIDDALISASQSVPAFPIMILVFVFMVIFLGGIANQRRREGKSDLALWGTLSGLATTLLALIFTLGAGMINIYVLSFCIGITLIFAIWLMFGSRHGETV